MRKWHLIGLTALIAGPALAADTGRYEAVRLQEGGRLGEAGSLRSKVFIMDTVEGHFWTWEEDMRLGWTLTYRGKVRPGESAGDIIEQSDRKRMR
ncbi:MAG: hypothetical protein QNK18_12530 [Gammaproteobacteria bacterium]|nr:hypothetical protein [Gammaproteobacteria bacterium]